MGNRYNVHLEGMTVVDATVTVVADTPEEALEKAYSKVKARQEPHPFPLCGKNRLVECKTDRHFEADDPTYVHFIQPVSVENQRTGYEWTPPPAIPMEIRLLQAVVYAMCGGGEVGRFAAEQPASFYFDKRVGGLPYPRKQILATVKILREKATEAGLNPIVLGPMPSEIRRCDIFGPFELEENVTQ